MQVGMGDKPRIEADTLLELVRGLVRELFPEGHAVTVSLDSALDRELGLDSLARVELLARIERVFAVSLSDQVMVTAETPRDLLRALQAAAGQGGEVPLSRVAEPVPGPMGAVASPETAATLQEVLAWHVGQHPERPHIYLYGDADQPEVTSYARLKDGAQAIAAGLRLRDLQPGQTVAIMLPTGENYFFSFFGVLLAGGIPVPIYPPARPSQIEEHLRRHSGILGNALSAILITVPQARVVARLLQSRVESLRFVVTPEDLGTREGVALHRAEAGETAFLQYTSGSTGDPKGVVLSHANLLANIRAMGRVLKVDSSDLFVSWLPLYHDMGLIGAWLGSLYYAIPLVVMSPLAFLTRPQRWLQAIHHHRGTLSAAPNFAYELCLRRIRDADIQGLDLSSWRLAINGAEPISPHTLERFCARFARYGFDPQAMAPVYGLAECSVGLALPPPGRGAVIDRVRRDALQRSGRALPAGKEVADALQIAACGRPLPGHEIRIVDDTGRELPERQQGQLQFRGPSATAGYFRNPEATRQLFRDGWLDSGDLAYMAEGDLYITGRAKEIIIRAGRNLHPYELEEAVAGIQGIRRGCVAVFASPDPESGTERLVVLAETRETARESLERLRAAINRVTVDLLGTPPDDVLLAPPHTVLKTSSGKIRRAASRALYEQGRVGREGWSHRWQWARLLLAGAAPMLRRATRVTLDMGYAAYAWTVFGVLAALTIPLLLALPRPAWRWTLVRRAARGLARLSGTPLTVRGLERLPRQGTCVLVANHASYLDGFVLTSILPMQVGFVAKMELAERLRTRLFLSRMQVEYVERFDVRQGASDARRLIDIAARGRSLLFFAEGTFLRMPGLRPFHMGAFLVAAATDLPVVPVTIRGTRSKLRPDSWFPRRGGISVTFGEPVRPEGSGWSAALQLRDTVRGEILRHCGEPDIAAAEPLHP